MGEACGTHMGNCFSGWGETVKLVTEFLQYVSAKILDFLKELAYNSVILKNATSIPSKLLVYCEIPTKIRKNFGEK